MFACLGSARPVFLTSGEMLSRSSTAFLLRAYSSLGSMQKCCQLWPLKCFEVLDWRHTLQRPLSVQSSSSLAELDESSVARV